MKSSMPDPETYPKKPRSTRKKWYAVIIVLVLIISSLGVLSLLHPESKSPDISVDTAPNYLKTGSNYTISLKANEPYKTLTIFWGDGNSTALNYTQEKVSVSHIYNSPGIYYIYYIANFTSGPEEFNTYIPVYVESAGTGNRTAEGTLTILKSSISPVVANSNIYSNNTTIGMNISNAGNPSNSTFTIVNQTLYVYKNGGLNKTLSPGNNDTLTVNTGYYMLKLSTITGNKAGTNYTTYYYMDIPVNPAAKLYINTVNNSIVMDSLTPYANLNPQEAYTTSELEILGNIEGTLVGNGSSGYFPEIAASLPSPHGKSYTFNISSKAKFSTGQPVTAYDVYYSLVMDLLLENKEPQTPGWLLAQYLLPGNYHSTDNYTNIKNAIAYNNSTQTVTLNFTAKLQPDTVFSILSSPGTFISSYSYLVQNGENLTLSPAGVRTFENSNKTYAMSGAISDGPYMILSSVPGEYITMVRNPFFIGNANNSVPTINSVTIDYISQYSSIYQDLRFNTSQLAIFPDTYPYTSYLTTVKPYNNSYNVSTIYDFNANVNKTILGKYTDQVNFPANLFSNITVREAFMEAYPGNNLTSAEALWKSFISNTNTSSRFHIDPSGKYNNKPLEIPIFAMPLVSGPNLSQFAANLEKMTNNSSSFSIVTEPVSFFNEYTYSGLNPMPIYETITAENMNLSAYYSYLGSTMNYTHAYNNGFSNYSFAASHMNQSIIMSQLNSNISSLVMNYNQTNLNKTKSLMNSLYLYINTSRSINTKLYLQNYITAGNGTFDSQGIVIFNRLSI